MFTALLLLCTTIATAHDFEVDDVKGENGKVKGAYYDIQGHAVETPTSGIYIIDGKKVLVK